MITVTVIISNTRKTIPTNTYEQNQVKSGISQLSFSFLSSEIHTSSDLLNYQHPETSIPLKCVHYPVFNRPDPLKAITDSYPHIISPFS